MRVLNNQLHEDLHLPNRLHCPYCNAEMNTATSPEAVLDNGDFGICVGCGEIVICVISEQGEYSLRETTDADINEAKVSGMYNLLAQYQHMIRNTNHGLKVKR